jgi:hypothetical protein
MLDIIRTHEKPPHKQCDERHAEHFLELKRRFVEADLMGGLLTLGLVPQSVSHCPDARLHCIARTIALRR